MSECAKEKQTAEARPAKAEEDGPRTSESTNGKGGRGSRSGEGGSSATAMHESARAKQAFDDYLAMGGGRSLRKLIAYYHANREVAQTVSFTTLGLWSREFGWQARLEAIAEEERRAVVARGISERLNRVEALDDRWRRMKEIIRARGEAMADVAEGGETGLLVRRWRLVGRGRNAQTVEEYGVDTALLKAMLEHEKQAAQELGQWTERQEHTGPGGGPIQYEQSVDPVALRAAEDAYLAALGGQPVDMGPRWGGSEIARAAGCSATGPITSKG